MSNDARLGRSRALRRDSTDAEALLWWRLRNRQVAGAKFRRQQPFGPYFLDFYCHEHKLIIEVDGGQHMLPEEAERDKVRTSYLTTCGLRVIRVTNLEVLKETDSVLAAIFEALNPSP